MSSKNLPKANSACPGNIIIIKGSPGVGKSCTSRKLVSRLPSSKRAIIQIDEILHLDQRPSLSHDKLKLAKFHTAILARSFLREEFDVIIEYTFDAVDDLVFLIDKIQHSHSETLHPSKIYIFHLTASIAEIESRNAHRRDGSDAMDAVLLHKLFKRCEDTVGKLEGEIVIDTSQLSVNQVIKLITKSLDEST